ncbi:MAG: HDOD domain-containing protein [Sedimentisphaerales bacterium]|nr:HDOD domain-containing protein [Sedimentisphaerales bacterium]
MVQEPAEAKMAKEVEHAVAKLENLRISPAAAAKFLSGLFDMRLAPAELCGIIESQPALAFMVYSLLDKSGKANLHSKITIRDGLAELGLREVRNGFFSLQLYQPIDGIQRAELREKLVINSVAVACISRRIAKLCPLNTDADLAYAAGLLYNIGNLALDEVMPRSFSTMVAQAESENLNICGLQQKNLGNDYTILGKRLAMKFHLPLPIQMAIWLHRTNVENVIETMPEAETALLVRAAYLLAGKFQFGLSGSFDDFEIPQSLLDAIGIESAELEDIASGVSQQVQAAEQNYAQEAQQGVSDYCKYIQLASAQLASEANTYYQQTQRAQTKSSHFDFTAELLGSIAAEAEPLDIAEKFACQWQKFYQTGNVCLYLTEEQTAGIDAVIIGGDNKKQIKYLKPPADVPAIPEWIQNEFRVIDTDVDFNWLFEQLDVEFERAKTKAAPLIFSDRAVGAIVFEFHYPVGSASLKDMFSSTCFVAAAILEAAFARARQQRYAENFVRLTAAAKPGKVQKETETGADKNIDVLAEMAAGAAHELNNPLSVISGRAELLSKSETEAQKKQYLTQIQGNCRELSGIIENLMAYARPSQPRKALVAVSQIIDEAMQLTSMKTGREKIDFNSDIEDDVNDIVVDSGQVVSSLANILTNAVESYSDAHGDVSIEAKRLGNLVQITISDSGCGMDEQTLEKACYPFFSSKPAGRKRGMGLAYAKRLIELNSGTLSIQSQPDEGTTVTVTLPSS